MATPSRRPPFPQAPPPAAHPSSLSPQQRAYLKLQRQSAIQFVHPPTAPHSVLKKTKSTEPKVQASLPKREHQHPASFTPRIFSRDIPLNKAKSFSGCDRVLESKLRPRVESPTNKSEASIAPFSSPRQVHLTPLKNYLSDTRMP